MILGGDIDTSKNKINGEFVTEKIILSGSIKINEYEVTPNEESSNTSAKGD